MLPNAVLNHNRVYSRDTVLPSFDVDLKTKTKDDLKQTTKTTSSVLDHPQFANKDHPANLFICKKGKARQKRSRRPARLKLNALRRQEEDEDQCQ